MQINKIEQLNQSSLIIKLNSFEQGIVEFIIKVKNQDGVSGSGQIFVDIISDKPIIMIDRAVGSITSKSDFNISTTESIDPNLNCTSF